MDIFIYTSEPESIKKPEIREALEKLGYYVGIITVSE